MSGSIESTESHVILGGSVAVCLLLSAHRAIIFVIAQLSCSILHWSSSVEVRITGHYHMVGFCMQVAKTLTILSCANFHFLLQYLITIHQHYRQTNKQMDVMLIA